MALVVQISTYEELKKIIAESGKEYDREQIEAAYRLAEEKHREQKRSSGEPYIIHPLSVAAILVGLGMDSQSVMAGLLHDVVEDTDCTLEDIQKQFGKEVALLIDGVTKLGKIPYSSREEQQAENLRKMLMAMAEDIRVIIIKFADRMHNLSTLEYMSPQKQRDKAVECLEVYAPIAHRLGIRTVKEYMEDVSLKYLDPLAYREIEDDLASRSNSSKQFIEDTKALIRSRVELSIPDVYIEGRVKSVYGIYRKMFIQGKAFDEIYDVFAVRVIVDTIEDCYNVLGIIHDMFQPLPNRFKDYISMPKPNMYQSLHTTVITKAGRSLRGADPHLGDAPHRRVRHRRPLEVQAGHVRQGLRQRRPGRPPGLDPPDAGKPGRKPRTSRTWCTPSKATSSPRRCSCSPPKGTSSTCPLGSTVIDFAYAIHTAVGNRMIGAKVDGRIVPLDYKVKTGEIVEILTTKEAGSGPNRDWLDDGAAPARPATKSAPGSKRRSGTKTSPRARPSWSGSSSATSIRSDRRGADGTIWMTAWASSTTAPPLDDFYAAIGYGGIQLCRS